MASSSAPTVSICLPVYNGEAFLRRAIESALNQTFTDFELLISDDQSTDSSREIISEFAQRDRRIRAWSNEKNLGLFENYNKCLQVATGSYIKLFAQDDVCDPLMLERLLQVFQDFPKVKLASCAKRWIGTNEETLESAFSHFSSSMLIPGEDVVRFNLIQLGNWVGEPSTVMFAREDVGQGFDTTFYHYGDIEYWFRIVEGGEFFYLNEVLCGFRRHPESGTSRNHKGLLTALDMLRLGQKYSHVLCEIGESEQHFYRRAIEVIALNIEHQVSREGLTANEAVKIGIGRSSGADRDAYVAELERALAGFKELSFYSLRYVTELLAEVDHMKRTRVDELELWQGEIHKLLNSPSWRVTAPLRALKNFVRSQPPQTPSG